MTTTAPEAEELVEPMLTAGEYIVDASHGIAVAGLLAFHSELAETQLTRAEWDHKLDGYSRHKIKD